MGPPSSVTTLRGGPRDGARQDRRAQTRPTPESVARTAVVAFLAAVLAAGCGGQPQLVASDGAPTSTAAAASPSQVRHSPVASESAVPASAAGGTPTPAPPIDLIVERFERNALTVFVELRNPNETYGLLRTDVVLTALDESGHVLGVQEGPLPGAPCCTIYRLAPKETYLMETLFEDAKSVSSIEVRLKGEWLNWTQVVDELPVVTLTGEKLRIRPFTGAEKEVALTGRVAVAGGGAPFNVQVLGLVEGANEFIVVKTLVECVVGPAAAGFEASFLGVPPDDARLVRAWAVTTTVPGLTTPGQPPGC